MIDVQFLFCIPKQTIKIHFNFFAIQISMIFNSKIKNHFLFQFTDVKFLKKIKSRPINFSKKTETIQIQISNYFNSLPYFQSQFTKKSKPNFYVCEIPRQFEIEKTSSSRVLRRDFQKNAFFICCIDIGSHLLQLFNGKQTKKKKKSDARNTQNKYER